MSLELTHRRFTVDDDHRMAEFGILAPRERVELIDGQILQMAPIGARHIRCAAAGIPEVWIVDLAGDVVEVYRGASEQAYREVRRADRGESVAPAAFPDLSASVSDILG